MRLAGPDSVTSLAGQLGFDLDGWYQWARGGMLDRESQGSLSLPEAAQKMPPVSTAVVSSRRTGLGGWLRKLQEIFFGTHMLALADQTVVSGASF